MRLSDELASVYATNRVSRYATPAITPQAINPPAARTISFRRSDHGLRPFGFRAQSELTFFESITRAPLIMVTVRTQTGGG